MANFLVIGQRQIPREDAAFVEPFNPQVNSQFRTSRDFQGRLVLINRDSVLVEEPPKAFAETHGFRVIADDNIAINPAIQFRVEGFEAREGFTPSKAFASRIIWRDFDGNIQSKLLLSEPDAVLACIRGGVNGWRGLQPRYRKRRHFRFKKTIPQSS